MAAAGLGLVEGHGAEQLLFIVDLNGFGELDGGREGSSVAKDTLHRHRESGVGGLGDLNMGEGHGRVVQDELGHLGQNNEKGDGNANGESDDCHDGAEDPVFAALVEGAGSGLGDLIVLFELVVVFIALVVGEVLNPVRGSTIWLSHGWRLRVCCLCRDACFL